MIKLVTILKGSAALTRAEFETRWHDVHAPIAAKFPGLRGYMLSFSIAEGDPEAEGVAQLWFDSREAAQAAYGSDIGRDGSADANAYLSRREQLLASEQWLKKSVSLAERPYKVMFAIKRPPGETRADFVTRWLALDTEAIASVTSSDMIRLAVDEAGQLLNSGTSGTLDLLDAEGAFDGLLETWFATPEDAKAAALRLAKSDLRRTLADGAARAEDFVLRDNVIVQPPPPAYGA